MVYEFPELQGVMGMHYARLAKEPDAVSSAIAEHYMPRGSGDTLPTTDVGAVVGMADRIDTLVGCFAAGLAPTGSADPYGLRRAALAILTVLIDRGWSVGLDALIDRAAESLDGTVEVDDERRAEVAAFFRVRLRGLLVDGNELPADCVEAALTAGFVNVPDARSRADAVATLRKRPDFEPLAVAFKRVANILKGETIAEEPDPDAFVEDEERALWDGFGDIRDRAEERLGAGDYHGSLQILAELKAPVDRFFDKVLVIHDDDRIRQNRLALLGRINATFTKIADFRQLSV
jgi:glycyl-tRNA synthetase beta chain